MQFEFIIISKRRIQDLKAPKKNHSIFDPQSNILSGKGQLSVWLPTCIGSTHCLMLVTTSAASFWQKFSFWNVNPRRCFLVISGYILVTWSRKATPIKDYGKEGGYLILWSQKHRPRAVFRPWLDHELWLKYEMDRDAQGLMQLEIDTWEAWR